MNDADANRPAGPLRILFVDDEAHILDGIRRMLFPMRKRWDMAFAHNGDEALRYLESNAVDLVVTDMRMPGMDGATLLTEVTKRYPHVVRFVLSGQSDKEMILRSACAAHQILSKPCEPQVLKDCIDRAFAIRGMLGDEQVRHFVSKISALPAFPEVYVRLSAEVARPESSIQSVARIIEADAALTAKILQLANSAFFAVRHDVSTVTQAVALLGLETVKSLTLMAGVFARTNKSRLCPGLDVELLWQHSTLVAQYALSIAQMEAVDDQFRSEVVTAGIVHDCGILILAENAGDLYGKVLAKANESSAPLHALESESLSCNHGQVGAYLLGLWGLPDPIVEAVAFHHEPGVSPTSRFSPLAVVHAADCFADGEGVGKFKANSRLDTDYMQRIGYADHLDRWHAACRKECGWSSP